MTPGTMSAQNRRSTAIRRSELHRTELATRTGSTGAHSRITQMGRSHVSREPGSFEG